MKTINYFDANGNRTSLTLSDFQLKVLGALADYYNEPKKGYIATAIFHQFNKSEKNKSTIVRDEMFWDLIFILKQNGIVLKGFEDEKQNL